ncbi:MULTISPECIES: glutamate--tRNA ligase [unclassified Arthrobacter]|uniref:glutamate--tRNA ligase n=1 Tax=unclassified Arthrobacter TaxID=235627 RepID=UPI0014931151|nr:MULTISPECIES: glutamate--tRNA ligase [unclassified Arthrobacter]MBE0010314.1 glutamate--tRNA ligase [Arthrobacter sp. AET 35A]NOJ64230.1 glutamate--tRNA ligase [Arthrobacter sp. 147(2020)]
MTIAAEIPLVTAETPVRVRFCPSPTGTPHVGLIRTALFNWAYARHTGGTMVFRIEDTDAARDSEESYTQLLDALKWLGIGWDEGVEVGGPHAPYRQSQRGELYRDVIAKLRAAGHLYESFSTPEEVEERHRAAGRDIKLGYDNHDRDLTEDQREAFRSEGRAAVLRLRMPDDDITFTDLVRGEITFRAGSIPDFAVVRANGAPLYTLVNPVDDALMGITHVLRGEDLLSSTPRQIALYRALIDIGVARYMPLFGHLPYVMGQGNKKLSKRDPESNLFLHRERGFIPEGLLNYLSLLGWSLSADEDIFTVDTLVEKFDIHDVLGNPARFDLKKAEAINGTHVRLLEPEDFRERVIPYLQSAGLVGTSLSERESQILTEAAPLIQERITLLGEAPDMLGFLFTDDAGIEIADDARKGLPENLGEVLDAAHAALLPIDEWTTENIQDALRGALVEDLGMKPRLAFGPVRTAVSGKRISPPLFESMVILGKESSLARISAFRSTAS